MGRTRAEQQNTTWQARGEGRWPNADYGAVPLKFLNLYSTYNAQG